MKFFLMLLLVVGFFSKKPVPPDSFSKHEVHYIVTGQEVERVNSPAFEYPSKEVYNLSKNGVETVVSFYSNDNLPKLLLSPFLACFYNCVFYQTENSDGELSNEDLNGIVHDCADSCVEGWTGLTLVGTDTD